MIKNLTIARRLALGFGLLLVLNALAASVFIVITRGINARLRGVADGLSEGAAQVAAAAGQVSGASQSLAEGSSEQAASLEVIFVSGYSAEIAGRSLSLEPGEIFLQKPFDPAQLLGAIGSRPSPVGRG